MRTAKWATGIIGIMLFIFASFIETTFKWNGWILAVASILLTICVILIIMGLFIKGKK
jgi:CHASE2 domain-containing sensor protein